MEGQQECSNFNSIILVGDSRVESLVDSFTWPHALTKLLTNSCKEAMIEDIIKMMEEELCKVDKSEILMIILGIHSDIITMINQKQDINTSILEDLVKKICYFTEKLKNLNPYCKFVWCLPSVPDFKRYNNKNCKKYIPYKEDDEEVDLVRKYFQTINKFKQMWAEIMPVDSQALVDLNLLGLAASSIANPHKTFAKFEDPEKLPSFTASQTTDGLHLSLKMSSEFWRYLYKCINHPSVPASLEKFNAIEKMRIEKDMNVTPGRRASGRVKLNRSTFSPTNEQIVSEAQTPLKKEHDQQSHSSLETFDIHKKSNVGEDKLSSINVLKFDSDSDKSLSVADVSNQQCKNVQDKQYSESKKVNLEERNEEDELMDVCDNLNSEDEHKVGRQCEESNENLEDDMQIEQNGKDEQLEVLTECEEEELIYEDILDKLLEEEENDNLKKEKEEVEVNEDYSDKFFSVDETDDKFFKEVCETALTDDACVKESDKNVAPHTSELKYNGHRQTNLQITNVEPKIINTEKEEWEVGESNETSTRGKDFIKTSFEADNLIQSNKVKEIVEMQKGRIQSRIVIVTDERDSFDINLAGFNSARVSVMKVPGLKMSDAFLSVKLHRYFRQGTIFIFSCGTHDLIESHSSEDCLQASCPFPQTMLSLPFPIINGVHYLVDAALNLNIDILLATENDIALFCGLIPVHIIDYNEFAAHNRPCYITHPIMLLPSINSHSFDHYKESVILYNKFIKYHATMLEFSSWILESEYVYLNKKQTRRVFLENRYNLHPEEGIRRANCAKSLCTKLLQTMVSSNAGKDKNVCSEDFDFKVAEIVENKDLLNEMAVFNDSVERIAKQKMRRQNNIVIITDDRDDFNLDYSGLEGKVSVLKKIGINLGNAFSTVQMHPNFGKGTIFVFSCGTHDILDSVILKDCLQSGCPTPQTLLIFNVAALRDSNYLINKALKLNNDILHTTPNDIALFCGITPVRVLHYNEFTLNNRPCHIYHPGVSKPYTEAMDYKKYLKDLQLYSSFIKYHAKTLGYMPWDLEQLFISRSKRVLLPNCYNLYPEEQVRRAQKAKKLCAELLLHSVSKAIDDVLNEPKLKLEEANQNIKFESPLFNELSVHGKILQEVEKLQKGRIQNNIVIVSDERDKFEEMLFNFDSKVDVMMIPNLKIGNALSHIVQHPKFGKGTIFVFSCGTHDLLQQVKAQECLPNCLSPQTLFSVKNVKVSDKHYLVKRALELNLEILQNTNNDIALFCGLIPVDVYKYNTFVVKDKPCGNFHKEIVIPNIDILVSKHYQDAISMFNSFIKYAAVKLSFSPWDLEQSYFSKNGNEIFLPNCYNFTPTEATNRADQVKLLCTELLLYFSKKSETSNLLEKPSIKQLSMSKDQSELKPDKSLKEELTNASNEHQINLIKLRYQDTFARIKSIQKERKQEFIVIVSDDRDDFVSDADVFDSKVSFLKYPALQLESAFTSIKTHPNFGKGTSFVFICGTYDVLNSVYAEECILYQCMTPQTMLTLPLQNEKDPLCLINRALQLNEDILNSTPNDIALFAGLIPVHINDYNKYAADHRPCKQYHTLKQIPVMSMSNLSCYEKCLSNYNLFTNIHAQELRYNPWNLHDRYFTESKTEIFLENFYHFSPEEQQQRIRKAKVLSTVMLLSYQRFKIQAKFSAPIPTPDFDPNSSTVQSKFTSSTVSAKFVPAGQVLPPPTLWTEPFPAHLQPLGNTSVYSEPYIPPILSDVSYNGSFPQVLQVSSKAKIGGNQYLETANSQNTSDYDRIVIVADRHDAQYINHLANNPKVFIYGDLELKVDYLQDYLLQIKDYFPAKTLYLLVVGIHTITRSIPLIVCQRNCVKSLELLEPLTYSDFEGFVQIQIQTMYNAISQVKLTLPNESNIEILPPLPASLIPLNVGHENLHKYNIHFPGYLLAQRMDVIKALFTIWFDQISMFTKPALAKYIEKCPSIEDTLSILKKIEVMNCGANDKPSFYHWKDMITNIIDAAIDLSTPLEINKFESCLEPTSSLEETAIPENIKDVTSAVPNESDLNSIIKFSKKIMNADPVDKKHQLAIRAMFRNVYIVKHVSQQVSKEISNLKKPSSDYNFKSVTIYHCFSNYGDDDVQSLVSKLGQYPTMSLCCLVFDLSVIATKQTISSTCTKQRCSDVIIGNALGTKLPNECNTKELEKLVENKIETIAGFIRKLNRKIPVIVFPLLPTNIFCEFGSSVEHQIIHSISAAGGYVVHESSESWNKTIRILINSWSKIMENSNKEYNFYDYIKIYEDRGRETFPIGTKLSDFVQQWKEPDIWRAFVETYLLSMVSPINPIKSDRVHTRMPDEMYVRIAKISSTVPSAFLTELFKNVEEDVTVEFKNGECHLKKIKLHKALLLIRKLNEFRIGGSQVKASLVTRSNKDYADYKITLMQDLYISSIFEKVYLKWKAQIISNIVKEIHDVHDFSSIKVYPCNLKSKCKGFNVCPYYHNFSDQRRNPLLHSYSSVACFHKKLPDDGSCSKHPEDCKFSRNHFEVQFNEAVYQNSVCKFKLSPELCNKKRLCSNAHRDTPEMLFTSGWKDTIVSGADLTIKYFTGAIRSVKKVGQICNLRIFLISPSVEFIDVADTVSRNLIQTFKLKSCVLGKNLCNPDDCEVLLGDPISFSKLGAEIFRQMKGVIIVDDARRIMENNAQTAALQKVFQMVQSFSLGVTSCTVFVYFGDDRSINRMMALLEKTLKIKLQVSVTDGNSSKEKSRSAEIDDLKQSRKRYSSSRSKDIAPKSGNAPKIHNREPRSRTYSLDSSSSSSSDDREHDKRPASKSLKHARRFSTSSGTQKKRSRSKSISKASSSIYKKRRSTDVVQPIENSCEKKSYFSDNQEDIRKEFGEILFQEYVESLEKLRISFEKEFSIFRDVPELCPHYEQCYDNFNSMYIKQHKNKDDEHKNKLWSMYWLSQFEEYKTEGWQTRQQKLYHEFKEKVLSSKAPSVRYPSISYPSHPRDSEMNTKHTSSQVQEFKGKILGKSRPKSPPSMSFPSHPRDSEMETKYSGSQDQVIGKQQNYKGVEEEKFSGHSSSSIGNIVHSKETGSFEFNEALSLLEKLSETVGFLGPSVSAMVASSREFGPNSLGAYKVFTDEENAMVVNMVLEKIKTLKLSASGSKLILYEKAIDWIPRLLEEAKKGPVETSKEKSLPIDIDAIAKVTHGKSSEFILKLIKTALSYEGIPASSKELVNDLFLKVCKIHFTLSMDD